MQGPFDFDRSDRDDRDDRRRTRRRRRREEDSEDEGDGDGLPAHASALVWILLIAVMGAIFYGCVIGMAGVLKEVFNANRGGIR